MKKRLEALKKKLEAAQAKQQTVFDSMIENSTNESITAYEMATKAMHLIEDQINELEKKMVDNNGIEEGEQLEEGAQKGVRLTEEQQFFRNLVEAVAVGNTLTALVPTTIQSAIQAKRDSYSKLRQFCTVHPTTGNYTFSVEGNGLTVDYVGEGDEIDETSGTVTPVTLSAYKLAALVRISREATNDLAINLQQYIVDQVGKAMAKKEDYEILHGSGTAAGHMTGIITAIEDSLDEDDYVHETKVASEFAFADLKAFIDSLGDYKDTSVLILNRSIGSAITEFKDGSRYIFDPNKDLDNVRGLRVVYSKDMPSAITDESNIALAADMSYYHIADRQGMDMLTLIERYAEYDQVGLRFTERIDGKPALLDAFKLLRVKKAAGTEGEGGQTEPDPDPPSGEE